MKMQFASKNKKHVVSLVVFYIVLVVLFCASVLGVWAFFTAQSQREKEFTFAKLNVNMLQNGSEITENSLNIGQSLLPGDKITLSNISIKNTEPTDVYVLLKVQITITASSGNVSSEYWCNLSGNKVDVAHIATAATLVKASTSTNIGFDETVDRSLGNDYKKSAVNVRLAVYGIQTLLETDATYTTPAVYASYLIINTVAKG